MRLSEIGNKEIVDVSTGRSYGQLWDAEMIFEKKRCSSRLWKAPVFSAEALMTYANCLGAVS